MRIYRPLYAIALCSAAAASPAMAQDASSDGFDRSTHFDGLYVSGFFGLDAHTNDRGETIVFDRGRDGSFGDTVTTTTGANAFSPGFCNGEAFGATPSAGCSSDKDGIVYGGRVGFDSRMGGGNFVVGGLVEFNKSES